MGIAAFHKNDPAALERHLAALTKLGKMPAVAENKTDTEENAEPVEKSDIPDKKKPANPENGKSAEPDKNKPAVKKSNSTLDNAMSELRALHAILGSKYEEATKELGKAGDTPKNRLVRYQLRMNEKEKAAKIAAELPEDAPGLALRVDALSQCGKMDEARKHFETLQTTGASMNDDLPFSKRMDELAVQFGIADSWRKPNTPRDDIGIRPPLESLGPLHWYPWDSPGFTLPDQTGRQKNIKDFNEMPLIVMFYLGHTCGHCMEQLKAFASAADDFKKAGIGMVAIGSEPVEELLETASACGNGEAAPFPLLADPSFDVFRKWRCYDDFEGMGMHGVFLVDAQGRVRWSDVGSDPFKDTRFLLEESKRLLKF